MIGKEVRFILTNDADLSDLIGDRVYSDLASQTTRTKPYIVYRVNDRVREHSQDIAEVDIYRIEFFIHGSTYGEVQEVEKRLDAAIDRYPIGRVINSYIMDGVMQEDSEDDPYDVDQDGSRTKITEYQVRVKVYDLGMIYSLTETDTNILWINGATVYERVFNLGAATGQTEITGLDKSWTVLDWSLIEVRGSDTFIDYAEPTSDGASYWRVNLDAGDTQSYIWVRYIKETAS